MLEDLKIPIASLKEDILNVWGRLWRSCCRKSYCRQRKSVWGTWFLGQSLQGRKGDDRNRPRRPSGFNAEGDDDRLTATDSLQLIESGIIERPDTTSTGSNTPITTGRKGKGKRNKNNPAKSSVTKPVATKNED